MKDKEFESYLDNKLLEWYVSGFKDELNSRTRVPTDDNLFMKAYQLGVNHAILGDDNRSFDNLKNEDILNLIKNN